jgi:hypothetical protein
MRSNASRACTLLRPVRLSILAARMAHYETPRLSTCMRFECRMFRHRHAGRREQMVFEEIIRHSPRRRASHSIAEGWVCDPVFDCPMLRYARTQFELMCRTACIQATSAYLLCVSRSCASLAPARLSPRATAYPRAYGLHTGCSSVHMSEMRAHAAPASTAATTIPMCKRRCAGRRGHLSDAR